MIERNIPFERDIFWLFPHDEEIGGAAAKEARKIFKSEFQIAENGFAFILDEGAPASNKLLPGHTGYFMPIGYTAKGVVKISLEVEFHGAGHGSIPGRESAITILTTALNNIDAVF